MSGLPNFNFPAFGGACLALRERGVETFSPHEKGGEGEEGEAAWNRYLREDLTLLARCRSLVLLPGWPNSRGAKLELAVALGLGMAIWFYDADAVEHLICMGQAGG